MIEPILATEGAECGLASMAMIANALGYSCTMRELRENFSISLKGANAGQLLQLADRLGLRARALRLELEEVGALSLPCIIHVDMNHFVVLEKVKPKSYVIVDPASGRRTLTSKQFDTRFTGIAIEVAPDIGFRPRERTSPVPLRTLLGGTRGLWSSLVALFVLSLALQVLAMISPLLLQWVVDHALLSGDADLLTVIGFAFGLALALQVAFSWVRGWALIVLSATLSVQWVERVFAHLLKLPLEFFEKRHFGDVVSRLGSVRSIQQTLSTSLVSAVIDGLMALITFALMWIYAPSLALISVGACVVYGAIRYFSYDALQNGSEAVIEANAKEHTHLLETLRGMQSIQINDVGSIRASTYSSRLTKFARSTSDVAGLRLAMGSASQIAFGVERIGVIWMGAALTLDGAFSVGMLIAYLSFKEQFTTRMSALVDSVVDLRMLRLHGERLSDILLTKAAPAPQSPVAEPWTPMQVTVNDLSYRYADSEPFAIEGLTLSLAAGESVAIVGPSGCGKTTLVKVLLGVLTAQRGEVFVNGERTIPTGLQGYRRWIGSVMQEDQLFAGSLFENIALGDTEATREAVVEAARMAAIADDIEQMPMRYETLVGDMGSSLSSGQRQRVLLARALYRKPWLLVLDEATSHLDVCREAQIITAINVLPMTRLIIAHRPETIDSAERVIEMAHGRIVSEYRPERPRPALS